MGGRHDGHTVPVAERVGDRTRVVHERHHVRSLRVHRGHPGLVHHREVVTVAGVLQLDLPIAPEPKLVHPGHLGGISVALLEEPLHPQLRIAKEILQRFGVGVEGGPDHPEVGLGAQGVQREVGLLHHALVTVGVGDPSQSAVQAVGPVVVGTGEAVRLSPRYIANGGAAVSTTVQQGVEVAFAVPGHDHRLPTDRGGLEASRLGDLALVGHPDPGAVEDLAHLLGEDLRIGVEAAGHPVIGHQVGGAELLLRVGAGHQFSLFTGACSSAAIRDAA